MSTAKTILGLFEGTELQPSIVGSNSLCSNCRTIYRGRIFNITRTRLTNPRTHKPYWRETVVHPGAVAIVPLIGKTAVSPALMRGVDRVVLVRQFRYPTGRALWEIPAGTLNKGESPLACARRELLEETGFAARTIKKVMEFYTAPGFCTEKIHLYVAKVDPSKHSPLELDANEEIRYCIFHRRDIVQLLKTNKIIDAKSIIGLMLWLKPRITKL
ncbi:MAG: NUDIX hydrolase [Planctomycetes bacterium]|nr:NUDIX hydrolase [Planctomycetota bacterium]